MIYLGRSAPTVLNGPVLAGGVRLSNRFEFAGRRLYLFREETELWRRLALVLGFAGLTGALAQVSVPLPFTPVPVTGQVFGVLVSATVLGRWLGPLSEATYLGLGAAGVPWFAPTAGAAPFSSGGVLALTGASGGYLLGFVVAAALVGWLFDRGLRERSVAKNLLVLLAGVAVVYAMGAAQFALVLGTGVRSTLVYAVVPFVPGDVLKAVLAALVLVPVVPRALDPAPGGRPARGRGIGSADLLAVGLLVAVTWSLVALIALTPWAPSGLLAYYVVAASCASVVSATALAARVSLERTGRALAGPPAVP